jgi:hypothetical protein
MTFSPKRVKQITVPHLKLEKGRPYYLKLQSEPFRGSGDPAQPDKPAPMVCRVVNLETGELAEVILPAVALKELTAAYPEGMSGKCIEFNVLGIRDGKNYNVVQLAEIEDPAAGAETPEEAEAAHRSMATTKRKR